MDSVDRPAPGLSPPGDRAVLESAGPPPPGCAVQALSALVGVPVGFALFVRAEGFLLAAGACALAGACAVGCPPRSWGRRIAWGLSLGCAIGTALGMVVALWFRGTFNPAGL